MEPVRNHRNKLVVDAARLHRARVRRQRGQTLLEGPALLSDALSAGARVSRVFCLPTDEPVRHLSDFHRLETVLVDERALQRLAGTSSPRGPVAIVDIPLVGSLGGNRALVSWGVSDPGNVGTLVRTAAAFGWLFAFTDGTADPWAPKTLRAGAGGQFQTTLAPISGLGDLGGWTTVATVSRGGEPPRPLTDQRVAVLVGEEAGGLSADVVSACSHRVTIPTPGATESLNASVAAAIVVYELAKGSGQPGSPV